MLVETLRWEDAEVGGCRAGRMQRCEDADLGGCRGVRLQRREDAEVGACRGGRMQRCEAAEEGECRGGRMQTWEDAEVRGCRLCPCCCLCPSYHLCSAEVVGCKGCEDAEGGSMQRWEHAEGGRMQRWEDAAGSKERGSSFGPVIDVLLAFLLLSFRSIRHQMNAGDHSHFSLLLITSFSSYIHSNGNDKALHTFIQP